MKLSFTHSQVVLNPNEFLSSVKHKSIILKNALIFILVAEHKEDNFEECG